MCGCSDPCLTRLDATVNVAFGLVVDPVKSSFYSQAGQHGILISVPAMKGNHSFVNTKMLRNINKLLGIHWGFSFRSVPRQRWPVLFHQAVWWRGKPLAVTSAWLPVWRGDVHGTALVVQRVLRVMAVLIPAFCHPELHAWPHVHHRDGQRV